MQPNANPDAKHYSILVVDDVRECADSLMLQLEPAFRDQFSVEVATSGPEALDLLREATAEGEEFAVIISDLIMSPMYGDRFLIEAHRLLPGAIKILYTGCPDAKSLLNILAQGRLDYFFEKPWQEEEMQKVVMAAGHYYLQQKLQPQELGTLQAGRVQTEKSLALAGVGHSATSVHPGENRLIQLLHLDAWFCSSGFEQVQIILLEHDALKLAKVFTHEGYRQLDLQNPADPDVQIATASMLEKLKQRQQKHQMLIPIARKDFVLGYTLVENPRSRRPIASTDLDRLQELADLTALLVQTTDILQKSGW
jgi:CheY-like chemotaxis protein